MRGLLDELFRPPVPRSDNPPGGRRHQHLVRRTGPFSPPPNPSEVPKKVQPRSWA
jgi:hypothetical protein